MHTHTYMHIISVEGLRHSMNPADLCASCTDCGSGSGLQENLDERELPRIHGMVQWRPGVVISHERLRGTNEFVKHETALVMNV